MNTKQKLAVLFIVIMSATSCSKEELPKPQTVTYEVWCDACAIVLEDEFKNRNTSDDLTDWKVFQVNGYLKYSFVNTSGLTEASANVYVSVFNRNRQEIKLKMYEDLHDRSDESEAIIDFPNGIGTDYNLSVNLRLN